MTGPALEGGIAELGPFNRNELAAIEEDPWAFTSDLGVDATRIDVSRVRPLEGRTSYTSTSIEAPLHTDFTFSTLPPQLQVLICLQPAQDGGSTQLVDGWAVLGEMASDPAVFSLAFSAVRERSFVVRWIGPLAGLRHGHLVLCFPGEADPQAPEEVAFAAAVKKVDGRYVYERRLEAGEGVTFDNHRMLHGRTGFTSPERELLKLHVWHQGRTTPPKPLMDEARAARERLLENEHLRCGLDSDQLALDGGPSADGRRLAAAVQRAMGRPEAQVEAICDEMGIDPDAARIAMAEALEHVADLDLRQ